jgi:cell wall-associated NlpC family hydrolase
VAAALSQLGVPYRFATAIPGVAFDCSGLTAWAWGRAGVALPHQSRAQYAALPHVSQSQVQPGDLLFYYNPIGHVAMYIGNGQLVQATHPGDVVSVNAVSWSRVVGIARP